MPGTCGSASTRPAGLPRRTRVGRFVAPLVVLAILPGASGPAAADSVQPDGSLPPAYAGHDGGRWGSSAVFDPAAGVAYVAGGITSGRLFDQVVTYNGTTHHVGVAGAKLPTPRAFMAAVWDDTDGVAYFAGGYEGYAVGGPNAGVPQYSNQVLRFDPGADTVSLVPVVTAPVGATFRPRELAAAVWEPPGSACPNGCAYILGGRTPAAGTQTLEYLDEIWRFEPGSPAGTLTLLSSHLPTPRCCGPAVRDGSGDVYLFGGYEGSGRSALAQIVRLRPSTGAVTVMGSLPSGRYGSSAAAVGSRIYLFGGTYLTHPEESSTCPLTRVDGEDSQGPFQTLDQIVRYDPSSNTVTPMPAALPTPPLRDVTSSGTPSRGREFTAAVWTGADVAIFGGGYDERCTNADAAQTTILRYEPIVRAPGPPREVRTVPASDSKQIVIQWKPPADNGGGPILRYHVYHRIGGDGLDVRVRDDNPEETKNGLLLPVPQPPAGEIVSESLFTIVKKLDLRTSEAELAHDSRATLFVYGQMKSLSCLPDIPQTRLSLLVNGVPATIGGNVAFDPCAVWPLEPDEPSWASFDVPLTSLRPDALNTIRIAKLEGVGVVKFGLDTSTNYERSSAVVAGIPVTLPGELMWYLDIYTSETFIEHGVVLPHSQDPGAVFTFVDETSSNAEQRAYQVTAENECCEGPKSDPPVTGVAPGWPDPPQAVSVVNSLAGGRDSVTVSWLPPADDGGLPIQSYYVFRRDESAADALVPDARIRLDTCTTCPQGVNNLGLPNTQVSGTSLLGIVPANELVNQFTDTTRRLGFRSCYGVAALTDPEIGLGRRSAGTDLELPFAGGFILPPAVALNHNCVYGINFSSLRVQADSVDLADLVAGEVSLVNITLFDDRNGNQRLDPGEGIIGLCPDRFLQTAPTSRFSLRTLFCLGMASPDLATTPSASVTAGGTISDTADVAGGFRPADGVAPEGTVTFRLYGPFASTPRSTDCKGSTLLAIHANIAASSATSSSAHYVSRSFTATQPGIYQWVAVYGGNASNRAVEGSCGDISEQVVVGPSA